jgi:uncharacterized protein (TIGR02270 family)
MILNAAIADSNSTLRARALRTVGELGLKELVPGCVNGLTDDDPSCRFWAAWSVALLGQWNQAIEILEGLALSASTFRGCALQLILKMLDMSQARRLLNGLAQDPADKRALTKGTGIVGDPHYIPWLVSQMRAVDSARLAGESFSFITGIDLLQGLETERPKGFESGPNEDPDDENVAVDPDESLPWPDVEKINRWWDANKERFRPGVRYFMGEPVNIENCKRVLREGYQRQRIAAACYLSLLQPGTPLFPTSAPAWRQKRWLDKMG